MPRAENLATTSLLLSIGIAAIAIILGLHQWSQHGARDPNPRYPDLKYFLWQDLRRGFGVALMLILALGIFLGSRMEPMIRGSEFDSKVLQALRVLTGSWSERFFAMHANSRFVAVWLGVIVLVAVLLALALFDWIATRRYADRQRRSLARERIEILRETLRQAESPRNGHRFGTDLEDG
jgi:hypothetical protein